MKLTLLGTGTPVPEPNRRGASQVIETGGELILIDCGRGCVDRLVDAGHVQPGGRALAVPLKTIALTHLHSDHITGLPDLLWAGWVMHWWEQAPALIGPPGTAAMIKNLMKAFAYDIEVRLKGEASSMDELVPKVIEVEEGVRSEGASWRIEAFRVDHAPVEEAFGYRVDAESTSIVVSGDTRYSENLIRHAYGADLLVHEVYSRRGMDRRLKAIENDARESKRGRTISSYHTPSDEVGKVAAAADVKQLVLSHLIMGVGGSAEDIAEDAGQDFRGAVTAGLDLQVFEV